MNTLVTIKGENVVKSNDKRTTAECIIRTYFGGDGSNAKVCKKARDTKYDKYPDVTSTRHLLSKG